MKRAAGFSLLEVVIAMGILAVSLSALLAVNASNLDSTARARDITVASLLARSKMIDLERELMDEGFPEGDTSDEGNFADEGRPEIKWKASITRVEITLDGLSGLCEGFTDESSGSDGGCEQALSSFGLPAEGFMSEVSNSVRLVELTLTWPVGGYTESMGVNALVTREDLALQNAVDQNVRDRQLQNTLNPTGTTP